MWHTFTSDYMQSYNMQSQSLYMQKAVWLIFTSAFPTNTCFIISTNCGVVLYSATCRSPWDALPACNCKNKFWDSPHSQEPPFYFRSWFPQAKVGWSSCVFVSKLHSWSPLHRWNLQDHILCADTYKPHTITVCYRFIRGLGSYFCSTTFKREILYFLLHYLTFWVTSNIRATYNILCIVID